MERLHSFLFPSVIFHIHFRLNISQLISFIGKVICYEKHLIISSIFFALYVACLIDDAIHSLEIPTNRLKKLCFSWKPNKPNHRSLNLNNTIVTRSITHEHLGRILNTKLNFQEYLKD